MGEKFDSHIDSGTPAGRSQFADPTGPGFPPAQYAQMAAGGAGWRQAFGTYDQRRVDDVVQMCNDTRERLARAGADEGSRLAALRDAENRLTAGLGDLELHGNQSDMTLQMLSREGTIPTPELEHEARASAKRLTKSVSDNVGPLEAFLADFISNVRSRALDAAASRVEGAVNRIGELAYTNAAQLYRNLRDRGQAEPDGAPPSPAGATA
jgi:hypothetical protein